MLEDCLEELGKENVDVVDGEDGEDEEEEEGKVHESVQAAGDGRRSKDEETWPTTLWTGCDVDDDDEGNMRMVNGEAGDLEPDIKPPVVEGLEGESAVETGEGMTVEGDEVEVTELKGTLLRSIGAKRDN